MIDIDLANALALAALVAPLYTRIQPSDALAHRTREAVIAHLRAYPGSTRRELCDALGVSAPTLTYHLELLAGLGLLHARRDGREIVYACGAPPRIVPRALRAPARATIARVLLAAPRTQNELAALTGASQRLVAYHLRQMGPFVVADGGRPARYALDPSVAAILS